MGSNSLGRTGLLNTKQHILQSVVPDEGHAVEQYLWHLKLLALEVVEGSLAGERGGKRREQSILSHTLDAMEASKSQAPAPKHCLHTCSLLCLKPLQ